MKKVYNYITIVETKEGLKLGRNCGLSCHRRNQADKYHERDREIIAAINVLDSYEKMLWLYEISDFSPIVERALKINNITQIITVLKETAKQQDIKIEAYTEKPLRWTY